MRVYFVFTSALSVNVDQRQRQPFMQWCRFMQRTGISFVMNPRGKQEGVREVAGPLAV